MSSYSAVEPQPPSAAPAQRETRLWHSQAHMPSVKRSERVIARGEGAYVWTEDGHRLLDLPASLWYANVGHGRREIAAAVAEQLGRIEAYSTFQNYATRPALALAERVAGLAPLDDPRICLTSGGSDSVDLASKLVRRFWTVQGRPEKRTIVTRDEAYHGLHGFGTSIAGIGANREGYGELVRETARIDTNNPESLQQLIHERGAGTIAAVFCEPVIGTGGVIPPAPGYLETIERLCREHDILFVADEVITGFGRTGRMFACERYGLRPDLMLLAKGISSGYVPLGAVVVARRIWEPFWEDGSDLVFRHGLTYAGHATACAAAMANLDILEREDLVGRVAELEDVLTAVLAPLAEHPLVREVRSGAGLLGAVRAARGGRRGTRGGADGRARGARPPAQRRLAAHLAAVRGHRGGARVGRGDHRRGARLGGGGMSDVVLVTGASSGIGLATARAYAARGARLGLLARRRSTLDGLVDELGAECAVALPADVADADQVAAALDALVERFGDVDVAVNSAGVCPAIALGDLTTADWRHVIDVNLTGTFNVAREAGLRMRAGGGGAIVNVGSEMGEIGAAGYVAYCASKAAVAGLTRALAAELAPDVRVNAVCPGPVDTPMLDAEFEATGDPERALRESDARVPLARRGRPEEVAEAIVYLAGSTYATGTALALDGGTTIT